MCSAFSSPPMRCSRPAVPGIAHGRARVSGSRAKGWNSAPFALAKSTNGRRSGRSSTSGMRHGSAPLAR